jgi:hypothetical protein
MVENNGYSFEEQDDPRTWDDSLEAQVARDDSVSESVWLETKKSEYIAEFGLLIYAAGQLSYHHSMLRNVKNDVKKVKTIAAAYDRDLEYYREQLQEWRAKADKSFKILAECAKNLGIQFDYEEKFFINELALHIDRRTAYKDYLRTAQKRNTPISPEDLEIKYQNRLKKRQQKKAH